MEDQELDDEMAAEENFVDPGEEDDDYDPDDEDSIGSEEEATSGFSDEEFTRTTRTTTRTTNTTNNTTIQSWRKPATGQLLRQGGQLSEYEKIREDNIREKEQLLRSLQGDWQEFKESEGLVVGQSQRGAKKVLKVLDRDPVKTRTSSLPAVGSGAQGDQRQPQRVPGEVGEGKILKKVPRGVLVKCEQCGEEVRGKNLLKEHIKFYHPKIKAQKPSRKAGKGTKSSGFQTPNNWVQAGTTRVTANASLVNSRGAKLQSMEVVRTREVKTKSLEDPLFSNCVQASTSAGNKVGTDDVSRGSRKQTMVDPFFANIDISPVSSVPPTRHQELEDLEENLVKELEPVEADMESIDHIFIQCFTNSTTFHA